MIGNIAREALQPLIKWMMQIQPPENLRLVWSELLEGLNARSYAQTATPKGLSGDRLWFESSIYGDEEGEIQPIVRLFLNGESMSLSPDLAKQIAADILLRVRLAEFCQELAQALNISTPNSQDNVQATIDGFCNWFFQTGGQVIPLSADQVTASVKTLDGAADYLATVASVDRKCDHLSQIATGLLIDGNFRLYLESLYESPKAHMVYQSIHLAMLSASEGRSNQLTPAEILLIQEVENNA